MWLAGLFAWGCLLMVCTSEPCPEGSDDAASWVRLKPLGHCRDGESTCPYRITLPPLTIQLPRPFRELEKMARELRSLTLMVTQLKEDCQECKERQSIAGNLRTNDGIEDGERIQASRATVNTKERQQDVNRRVSDFINSNTEEKDMMFIIGDIKKKNPEVVEKHGPNGSLERSMYPSPTGQRVETNKGSHGYDPSRIERKPDNVGEMRQQHSITAEERGKELQSLRVKPIESSLPGNRHKEQGSPHHGRQTAYTVRVRTGEDTSGTLTAQGKVESIPEISLVSMATDDDADETKQMKNKETPMKRFPGFTRLTDSNSKDTKPNPNAGNRFKNPGGLRKVYSPIGNRTVKAAPRLSGLNPYKEDHKTNKPDRIRIVMVERQPATATTNQNNKELGQNMTVNIRTLLDNQKELREKVKDSGVEELETFTIEGASKPSVAKEGRPRVLQFPDAENKERDYFSVISTEPPEFNHGTDSGIDTVVDSNPRETDETAGGFKETRSSNSDRPSSTHRTSQTLDGNSENLFHPGTDVTDGDTGVGSNPVKRFEKVSRLEGPKSFVSARPDATKDIRHTNPLNLDTYSKNLFFSGTDTGIDSEEDLSQSDRVEKVSRLESVVTENADDSDDIGHTKQHTLDTNAKSPLKSETNAESDTAVDTGPLRKIKKVNALKESRSFISGGVDTTDDVQSTNSSNLDSNHSPKGPKLKSDTTEETDEEIQSSVPFGNDTNIRAVQRNSKPASLKPVKQDPLTVDSRRVIKGPTRGVNKPGPPTIRQDTQSVSRPRNVHPLKIQEVNLRPTNGSKISSGTGELNQPNLRIVKNVTRVNPNYMRLPERTNLSGIIKSKYPKQRRPYVLQRIQGNESVPMNVRISAARDAENITDTNHHKVDMNNGRKHVHPRTGFFSHKKESKKTENEMSQSIRPTVVMHETVDQVVGEEIQASPTVEALNPLVNLQIENTSQRSKLLHPVEFTSSGENRELDPITAGVKEHGVEAVMNQNTLNFDRNIDSVRGSQPASVEKSKNNDRDRERNPVTANSRNSTRLTMVNQSTKKKELNSSTTTTTTAAAFIIKYIIKDKQSRMTHFTTPTLKTQHFMDQDHTDNAKTTSGVKVLDINVHHRPKTSSQERDARNHEISKVESLKPTVRSIVKTRGSDETVAYPNSIEDVQNREGESNPFVTDRNKNRKVGKKASVPFTDSKPDMYSEKSKASLMSGESLDDNNGGSTGTSHSPAIDRAEEINKEMRESAKNHEMSSNPNIMDRIKESKLAKFSVAFTASPVTSDFNSENDKSLVRAGSLDDSNGNNNGNSYPISVDKTKDRVKETRDSAQNKESGSNPIFMDRIEETKLTMGSNPFTVSSLTSDFDHENDKYLISAESPDDITGENQGNSYPVSFDRTEDRFKETRDHAQNKERGTNPIFMDRSKERKLAKGSIPFTASSLTSNVNHENDKSPISADSREDKKTEHRVKGIMEGSQNRGEESDYFTMDRVKDSTVAKDSNPLPDDTLTPAFHRENIKTPVIRSGFLDNNNGDRNGNSYPSAMDQTEDIKSMRVPGSHRATTESTSTVNDERPFTMNNIKSPEDVENQLLTTCHGQCDLAPTPQPALNAQRSSHHNRDKPPQDCADIFIKNTKNGVYSVTPGGPRNATFSVFCDMEAAGGGWTLIQHRFDGSLSFNRSWNDYKRGFGSLTGEFWLGNDKIHWLTAVKAMMLRIELEDLDGIKEYAQYDQFHVANESQNYKLTIGGYSGTAGNALQYSKKFNHNQKYFTTPDRDNDQYPSGNCGNYYGSGWWFDACMAANLNGKYYQARYKGVRNGIFWGTWQNISDEYYPTNERQSFKTVRMMIKPLVVF